MISRYSKSRTMFFGWLLPVCMAFLLMTGSAFAQAVPTYTESACEGPYNTVVGEDGTSLLGSGDDATFALNLSPIPFSLFGSNFTSLFVGTNGFIYASAGSSRGFGNSTLPTNSAGAALYPFWDDLQANTAVNASTGVYWRQDGVAPNRVVTIEWYQIGHFSHIAGQEITFQVRLFEGSNVIEFHYLDVNFGGSHAGYDQGLSATVGMEGALVDPRAHELYSFNQSSLSDGQCIRYTPPIPEPIDRTTFLVSKEFSDDNPSEVEVSISCNTGLLLDQSKLISEGSPVTFVVTEFDPDGTPLNCTITETAVNGYNTSYRADGGSFVSGECEFLNAQFSEQHSCEVVNNPAPVTVTIDKEWVFEGSSGPDGIDTNYRVDLRCYGEIVEINHGSWGDIANYGDLWRARWDADDSATFTAEVVPEVYPVTECWVEESVYDDAVEIENDCGYFNISVGSGYGCTITNTVFFEGIPTLNPQGIALLAMLVLGIGFVGFRRFA